MSLSFNTHSTCRITNASEEGSGDRRSTSKHVWNFLKPAVCIISRDLWEGVIDSQTHPCCGTHCSCNTCLWVVRCLHRLNIFLGVTASGICSMWASLSWLGFVFFHSGCGSIRTVLLVFATTLGGGDWNHPKRLVCQCWCPNESWQILAKHGKSTENHEACLKPIAWTEIIQHIFGIYEHLWTSMSTRDRYSTVLHGVSRRAALALRGLRLARMARLAKLMRMPLLEELANLISGPSAASAHGRMSRSEQQVWTWRKHVTQKGERERERACDSVMYHCITSEYYEYVSIWVSTNHIGILRTPLRAMHCFIFEPLRAMHCFIFEPVWGFVISAWSSARMAKLQADTPYVPCDCEVRSLFWVMIFLWLIVYAAASAVAKAKPCNTTRTDAVECRSRRA